MHAPAHTSLLSAVCACLIAPLTRSMSFSKRSHTNWALAGCFSGCFSGCFTGCFSDAGIVANTVEDDHVDDGVDQGKLSNPPFNSSYLYVYVFNTYGSKQRRMSTMISGNQPAAVSMKKQHKQLLCVATHPQIYQPWPSQLDHQEAGDGICPICCCWWRCSQPPASPGQLIQRLTISWTQMMVLMIMRIQKRAIGHICLFENPGARALQHLWLDPTSP